MRRLWPFLSICLAGLVLTAGSLPAQSDIAVDGDVAATSFTGDGSNLTNVPLSGWASRWFDFSCSATSVCFVFVGCGAGETVLSGGLELPGLTLAAKGDISLADTYPLSDTQWQATATNFSASTVTYRAWAICAPVAAAAAPDATAPFASPTSAQPADPERGAFLMCPDGDTSRWVGSEDRSEYFCEHHSVPLQQSGGHRQPIRGGE